MLITLIPNICEQNIFLTDPETDRQRHIDSDSGVSFPIIDLTARLRLNQGMTRQSWIPVSAG